MRVILLASNESPGFEFVDALAKKALRIEGSPGFAVEKILNKFIVATRDELLEIGGRSLHWSASWEAVHNRFYKIQPTETA